MKWLCKQVSAAGIPAADGWVRIWLVLSSLWIISIASIDVIHYLENQASQVQLERAARLPRVSDGLSLGIWAPFDPRTEQEKRADQLKDNIAFVA